MRKAALFAGVAAVIAVYGVWAASISARVAPTMGPTMGLRIDPFEIMVNAKDLPTREVDGDALIFDAPSH